MCFRGHSFSCPPHFSSESVTEARAETLTETRTATASATAPEGAFLTASKTVPESRGRTAPETASTIRPETAPAFAPTIQAGSASERASVTRLTTGRGSDSPIHSRGADSDPADRGFPIGNQSLTPFCAWSMTETRRGFWVVSQARVCAPLHSIRPLQQLPAIGRELLAVGCPSASLPPVSSPARPCDPFLHPVRS